MSELCNTTGSEAMRNNGIVHTYCCRCIFRSECHDQIISSYQIVFDHSATGSPRHPVSLSLRAVIVTLPHLPDLLRFKLQNQRLLLPRLYGMRQSRPIALSPPTVLECVCSEIYPVNVRQHTFV